MDNFTLLDILTIIFWAFVYIFIIFYSFKNKKCIMPLSCLSLNLIWEILRFFRSFDSDLYIILGILSWIFLDLIILISYYLFGGLIIHKNKYFLIISIIIHLISACVSTIAVIFLQNYFLSRAFLINLYMSIVFLFYSIRSKQILHGILVIFVLKFIGTLFSTIANGVLNQNIEVMIIGFIIAYVDIISIFVVLHKANSTKFVNKRLN